MARFLVDQPQRENRVGRGKVQSLQWYGSLTGLVIMRSRGFARGPQVGVWELEEHGPASSSSTTLLWEYCNSGGAGLRRLAPGALVPFYLLKSNQVMREVYSCFHRMSYHKASITIDQLPLARLRSRIVSSYMQFRRYITGLFLMSLLHRVNG